jgi:hypothetical protein
MIVVLKSKRLFCNKGYNTILTYEEMILSQ